MSCSIVKIPGCPSGEIKVYQGIEGVREITYNSLEADGLLRIYELTLASLGTIFTPDEADDVRREFMKRNIKIKEITAQSYMEYTKVEGFEEKCMEYRYIDPKKFDLQTEIMIYNDIVTFYRYEGDIFGVEVKSKDFAQAQARIFDFVWSNGERPVVGKRGRSSMF